MAPYEDLYDAEPPLPWESRHTFQRLRPAGRWSVRWGTPRKMPVEQPGQPKRDPEDDGRDEDTQYGTAERRTHLRQP